MEFYDCEKFIENYELTKEEYLVLSFDERMEYANQLFGYKIANLKNVGDRIVFGRVIESRFYEYFEYCGCQIIDEDLGAEVTEVIKVGNNNYEPKEGMKEKLEAHKKLIAITKEAIIEERKRNFYRVKKGRKSRQFAEKFPILKEVQRITNCKVENLPAYEQRWLIAVQFENLIKNLNNGKEEYLDTLVAEEYLNYLKRNGYKVEKDEDSKRYILRK